MADTGAVDAAVIAHLAADPTIASLCEGVFLDVAPAGSKTYVTVSRRDSDDQGVIGGKASTEVIEFVVTPTDQSTSVTTVRQLAARVHELLEGATLTIPGYHSLAVYRLGTHGPNVTDDGLVVTQQRPAVYELTVEPV